MRMIRAIAAGKQPAAEKPAHYGIYGTPQSDEPTANPHQQRATAEAEPENPENLWYPYGTSMVSAEWYPSEPPPAEFRNPQQRFILTKAGAPTTRTIPATDFYPERTEEIYRRVIRPIVDGADHPEPLRWDPAKRQYNFIH
jgi:hypothetical protein